jgi:predicted RNA binding protein YcfA (HicA-like mRNA interferase family)
MKLPRDISGRELANLLTRYGYSVTRQTGSHLRLTTQIGGEHHLTIPAHSSLRLGTVSAILSEVAQHLKRDKSDLIRELWV